MRDGWPDYEGSVSREHPDGNFALHKLDHPFLPYRSAPSPAGPPSFLALAGTHCFLFAREIAVFVVILIAVVVILL